MYVAEYQMPGASSIASEHDHEPVKPKSRSREDVIKGDKPLMLTSNLAGTIESVQAVGSNTKILIRYLNQLRESRLAAHDPHFEPMKQGMAGVVDGTDIWFTVTSAAAGHAVAEIHGRPTIRVLQMVSINPDDARLALVHSRRPPPGPTWANHTDDRGSLF